MYNNFHANLSRQKHVIDDSNFTFIEILILIKKLKIWKKKIIDVGCGAGAIDFYLASKNNHVTGADISTKAIESCRENAKRLGVKRNANFFTIDLNSNKLNGKYDIALCLEIIEHIKNDKKLLSSLNKVLKKNGLLILSTPSIHAPLYRIGFLKKFDKRVGHLRRYNVDKISGLIEDSGFNIREIIRTEGVLRNFLFTSKIGSLPLRIINKLKLGNVIRKIDLVFLKLFGESNYIIVAQKK